MRPCLNFGFYPVLIACLQAEIDTGESSCYVRKAEPANSLPFVVPFHVGAYFCMGAYQCNVVVVIKMDVYIHGVLIITCHWYYAYVRSSQQSDAHFCRYIRTKLPSLQIAAMQPLCFS